MLADATALSLGLTVPPDFWAPAITFVVVAIPLGLLWAFALADCIQRPEWQFPGGRSTSNERMMWLFALIVLSGIASIPYYFMVMRPYPRQ
jgi:hypothetical protein